MIINDVELFVYGISITLLIVTLVSLWRNRRYNKATEMLEQKLTFLESRAKKELSDRKSSEIRLGKIGENMAPFFRDWPYDPNQFRFLGNPVDGIQFGNDEVVFVEIKTGKARLTASQKTVKQLVQEGKVKFATFRVGEDGCTLKVEE